MLPLLEPAHDALVTVVPTPSEPVLDTVTVKTELQLLTSLAVTVYVPTGRFENTGLVKNGPPLSEYV